MNYLITKLHDNNKISDLQIPDYILANYVNNDNRYPPHLWAEPPPPSNEPKINNGLEYYHQHLKDQFYNLHPLIYIFIEETKEYRAEVYIKL